MKKLMMTGLGMLGLGMLAVAPNAFADETICGQITAIDSIVLSNSSPSDVPLEASQLNVTFMSSSGQRYELPLNVSGTQLSLALLKAFNNSELDLPLDVCLAVFLFPFSADIVQIEFGQRQLPLWWRIR